MIFTLANELIYNQCPVDSIGKVEGLLNNGFEFPVTERIQLAVLKNTSWNVKEIEENILVANTDWRDLLMQAGFGENLTAHENWQRDAIKYSSIDI